MTALVFFATVITAIGLFAVGRGLVAAMPSRTSLAQRLSAADDMASTREAELASPFVVRVLEPTIHRFGDMVAKRLPQNLLEEADRFMASGGGLFGLRASEYYGLRLVLGVVGLGAGILLAKIAGDALSPLISGLVIGGCAVVGFMYLRFTLLRNVRARQTSMRKALPAVLDLLCIGVEAGMAIDVAMSQVAEKFSNALSREISATLDEIRLGRPRIEALQAMADRVGLDELNVFVDAVAQSLQLGTSLSRTLRIQAEEMRRRRRQRAEELGAKAPLKMLFPMIGCIFPTLFVVILGPAALVLIDQFTGGGGGP